MRPIRSEADLDVIRRTAHAYMMISAWGTAGYFDAFGDGEFKRLEQLSGDQRALGIGARILGHLGLLQTDGTRWAFTPTGLALWQAGSLGLAPHAQACTDFAELPTLLQEGTAIAETDIGVVESEPERVRAFMDMLYRRSETATEHVAHCVSTWLPSGARVLDLGGGHGRYAHAMLSRGLQAVLFDKHVCVDLAKERYGDALEYIAGDFHTDDLGGSYDAIILSNIVHGLDATANQALIERLADHLEPGGRLVIKDMFSEGNGLQPEHGVLFAMMMLMFTQGGRTYSVGEMQDMIALSGLSPAEVVDVPDQGFSLVVGKRLA